MPQTKPSLSASYKLFQEDKQARQFKFHSQSKVWFVALQDSARQAGKRSKQKAILSMLFVEGKLCKPHSTHANKVRCKPFAIIPKFTAPRQHRLEYLDHKENQMSVLNLLKATSYSCPEMSLLFLFNHSARCLSQVSNLLWPIKATDLQYSITKRCNGSETNARWETWAIGLGERFSADSWYR